MESHRLKDTFHGVPCVFLRSGPGVWGASSGPSQPPEMVGKESFTKLSTGRICAENPPPNKALQFT